MNTQIQKWGNSLGVRIPINLAKQLHLHPGTVVNIEIENGKLVMQSAKYDLNNMIEGITPQNIHSLQLDDMQKGNEEW